MNLKKLKIALKQNELNNFFGKENKCENEIYVMHVKSSDPMLGEIEYWKSGPKKYEVRPIGSKDTIGSIIEFQKSFILMDDSDEKLYPSIEEGVHALVRKCEKDFEKQRNWVKKWL